MRLRHGLIAGITFLAISLPFAASAQNAVDASTLDGKFLMGYQGWFSAPGDGSPLGDQYSHWTHDHKIPRVIPQCDDPASANPKGSCGRNGNNLSIDMWPDMRELGTDEKYPTEFTYPDGKPVYVFSSANLKTMMRHFQWMQEYGIDGVLAQYNLNSNEGKNRDFKLLILEHMRQSAEAYGRVFAVRYDVTAVPADQLFDNITQNWMLLVDQLHITDSSSYLHHKGKPLVSISHLGLHNADPSRYPSSPDQAMKIIRWFTHDAPAKYQATVLGVVPSGWSTLSGNSLTDPKWRDVYLSYDVIMPWITSRFKDVDSFEKFEQKTILPEAQYAAMHHIEYIPMVFPGFSWSNENGGPLNKIPRGQGLFLWKQMYTHIKNGNRIMFAGMFDEINEGTAFFKIAPNKSLSPSQVDLVTIDQDGHPHASDWYLCLTGQAAYDLHSHMPIDKIWPKPFSVPVCNRNHEDK